MVGEALEEEGLEEEAAEQVDLVLAEISECKSRRSCARRVRCSNCYLLAILKDGGTIPDGLVSTSTPAKIQTPEELDEMRKRLEALRTA